MSKKGSNGDNASRGLDLTSATDRDRVSGVCLQGALASEAQFIIQ